MLIAKLLGYKLLLFTITLDHHCIVKHVDVNRFKAACVREQSLTSCRFRYSSSHPILCATAESESLPAFSLFFKQNGYLIPGCVPC